MVKRGLFPSLSVQFDTGVVEFEAEKLKQLELAYCLTVHKVQGCEFQSVIMPCSATQKNMMTRHLVYTAITRAKKQLAADKRKHALIQCKSAILMAVAVYINLAVYYGTLRSTALYCLLISLIGFVFCYPKQIPDAENKEK